MTRDEVKTLLEIAAAVPGASIQRVEAKQYEPETVAVACPHCGTRFRIIRYQDSKPWVDKHIAVCATKTEAERKFYFEYRRWAANAMTAEGHYLAVRGAELIAAAKGKSGAERTKAWRERKGRRGGR